MCGRWFEPAWNRYLENFIFLKIIHVFAMFIQMYIVLNKLQPCAGRPIRATHRTLTLGETAVQEMYIRLWTDSLSVCEARRILHLILHTIRYMYCYIMLNLWVLLRQILLRITNNLSVYQVRGRWHLISRTIIHLYGYTNWNPARICIILDVFKSSLLD